MKRFLLIATLGFTACAHRPTLTDMVKAGHYDFVEQRIDAKNFPVKPERFVSEHLFVMDFGREMNSAAVLEALDLVQLRAATIEELLSYAATHPEEQRQHAIFALGSSCSDARGRGGYDIPYIFGGEDGRGLFLHWVTPDPDEKWGEDTHFLVTPK